MFLADERELSPSAYQHRQTVNMMFLADERELSPPHTKQKIPQSRKVRRADSIGINLLCVPYGLAGDKIVSRGKNNAPLPYGGL